MQGSKKGACRVGEKKCNSKLSGSVHNPRGRVVVQVALFHCQRFSGRFWEQQMLMTAEVTEDRFLGAVTRTKNLPSSYFIMMSSIPPVPEAIVVTITGWKRYSVGTPLDVRIMCFKPVDSKNQRVPWSMNNVKLELFNIVSNFNFNRWCFLGYGSINQCMAIYSFQHQRKYVTDNGQLLSKKHRVVNAVPVGTWIHHSLLKELLSSQSYFNSKP